MILVLVIFVAEVSVVTVGTLRIIFVSRGHKLLAPLLGFFEIGIWLFAITQTIGSLSSKPWEEWSTTDWGKFMAFALGFTLGNFLGILIEKKLALGSIKLHVVTQRGAAGLVEELRAANFGATIIEGQGADGPVDVILTVIRRRQLSQVVAIIERFDASAFYAVNEVQSTSAAIFPVLQRRSPAVQYTWHMVSPQETAEGTGN